MIRRRRGTGGAPRSILRFGASAVQGDRPSRAQQDDDDAPDRESLSGDSSPIDATRSCKRLMWAEDSFRGGFVAVVGLPWHVLRVEESTELLEAAVAA